VPGATHLFVEPGTLDTAAGLARDWFLSQQPRARLPRAYPSRRPDLASSSSSWARLADSLAVEFPVQLSGKER